MPRKHLKTLNGELVPPRTYLQLGTTVLMRSQGQHGMIPDATDYPTFRQQKQLGMSRSIETRRFITMRLEDGFEVNSRMVNSIL